MALIQDTEALKTMTENDLEEYKEACKSIGELRDYYQDNIQHFNIGENFIANFAFKTSESARFYNLVVNFYVKKRRFKKKMFFYITQINEVSANDFLDMMNEAKKYTDEEKE